MAMTADKAASILAGLLLSASALAQEPAEPTPQLSTPALERLQRAVGALPADADNPKAAKGAKPAEPKGLEETGVTKCRDGSGKIHYSADRQGCSGAGALLKDKGETFAQSKKAKPSEPAPAAEAPPEASASASAGSAPAPQASNAPNILALAAAAALSAVAGALGFALGRLGGSKPLLSADKLVAKSRSGSTRKLFLLLRESCPEWHAAATARPGDFFDLDKDLVPAKDADHLRTVLETLPSAGCALLNKVDGSLIAFVFQDYPSPAWKLSFDLLRTRQIPWILVKDPLPSAPEIRQRLHEAIFPK